jgi:hypothetical protein
VDEAAGYQRVGFGGASSDLTRIWYQ